MISTTLAIGRNGQIRSQWTTTDSVGTSPTYELLQSSDKEAFLYPSDMRGHSSSARSMRRPVRNLMLSLDGSSPKRRSCSILHHDEEMH